MKKLHICTESEISCLYRNRHYHCGVVVGTVFEFVGNVSFTATIYNKSYIEENLV